VGVIFYRDWLENHISTDCLERTVVRKTITLAQGLRARLETTHFVVEPLVSKALFVKSYLFLCGLKAHIYSATI
jgi:hypothetical protein|tara:strand:+ start:494 stop:715 length:222 start_codon:yes stop_codon:yes gene_type:complete